MYTSQQTIDNFVVEGPLFSQLFAEPYVPPLANQAQTGWVSQEINSLIKPISAHLVLPLPHFRPLYHKTFIFQEDPIHAKTGGRNTTVTCTDIIEPYYIIKEIAAKLCHQHIRL